MRSQNSVPKNWSLFITITACTAMLPNITANVQSGCSNNCMVVNSRYTVGNDGTKSAPRMKHMFTYKDITLKQFVTISCVMCHSNPPSSLTWYHNGKPLYFKKHQIKRIKVLCGEKLSIKVRSQRDVGVYMCVARNALGEANSTTQVREHEVSIPSKDLSVRGESMMGHSARLGSTIDITCSIYWKSGIRWSWRKDSEVVRSGHHVQGRIEREEYSQKDDNNSTKHVTSLKIRDLRSSDKGKYKCVCEDLLEPGRVLVNMSVTINVVRCFQGYYCPSSGTTERCPKGTFSWSNDATTVDECKQCPTNSRNETLNDLKEKNPQMATVFRINCPDLLASDFLQGSRFSAGVKAAIAVAIVAFISASALVIFCILKNWRREKEGKLFEPSEFVELEIPDIPLTNDVYVCYSSKNRAWVHGTLLANLKAQDFLTVIDFVDFEIGLAVQENITRAIYGSRKTIFVLSKDAIRCFHARTELRQALVARKEGRQVIIVLYEKVKLPVEITKRVYLDWTDERNRHRFWEKLYGEIRRPLDVEMV